MSEKRQNIHVVNKNNCKYVPYSKEQIETYFRNDE